MSFVGNPSQDQSTTCQSAVSTKQPVSIYFHLKTTKMSSWPLFYNKNSGFTIFSLQYMLKRKAQNNKKMYMITVL